MKEQDNIMRDKSVCVETISKTSSIQKLAVRTGNTKAAVKLFPISPIDPSDLVTQLLRVGKKTEYERFEEELKEKERIQKSMLEPVSKSIMEKMAVLKEKEGSVKTQMNKLKEDILKYLKKQFIRFDYGKRFNISYHGIMKALLGRDLAEKEKAIFENEKRELAKSYKLTLMYNLGEAPKKH